MNSSALLRAAHLSMAITLMISLSILYIIYGAELSLTIPTLIFLHILFIMFATIFKISYVARLTALKQLGRPVH